MDGGAWHIYSRVLHRESELMKETYSQLKKRIIEKSLILVEAGDMSSVREAMQALNEMAKLETSNISSPLLEVDRLMDTLDFAPDDRQFLKSEWISVSEAANWSQVSQDTIREWCETGLVVAAVDSNKKRKIWKVCPKSIGIKLHNIKDPRL